LESAYKFLDKYKQEMTALSSYSELDDYLKGKSGNWKDKLLNSIRSKDILRKIDDDLSDDMFVRPKTCGAPNGECISGLPFAVTSYKPQTFNTHYRLRDYMMNRVPFNRIEKDLGWKLYSQENIVSMEQKTGGPGNMDDKFHFKYDTKFYIEKYKEYLEEKGLPDKKAQDMSGEDMDAFEQYLIEKELYIQFKVLVPQNGNGTVALFHQFSCPKEGKTFDKVGSKNFVHKYIAKVDEPGIGQLGANVLGSDCKFQGLETGQKYKVTIVPYNIALTSEWQFAFIFAF